MIRVVIKSPSATKISNLIKEKLVNSKFINEINSQVIPEVKRFMAAGLSPVQGKPRFVQYKDKFKYPGKRKPSRPVNLKLSGDLYSVYVAAKKTSHSFFMGISSLASDKIKTYAKANNLGTDELSERRFIPIGGETYKVTIMRMIKNLIARRIAEIIKNK